MSLITAHNFKATNPAQMRLEIEKLAYTNPLVNKCVQLSIKHGLRECDFLTMLAYSALEALNQTQLHYMAELSMRPSLTVEKAS